MEKIILKSKLFYGLDESTIHHILSCIEHKTLIFSKGEYLYDFSKGFKAGIVLNGRIDLSAIDDDKEIIDRIYETSDSFSLNFSSLSDRFMVAGNLQDFCVCSTAQLGIKGQGLFGTG